jgi:AcrR family transcriptional regulator
MPERAQSVVERMRIERSVPLSGRNITTVVSMGRRRADVRREEILRAAAAVVGRQGFARTRAADVAAELGISTALVFYHFDSKERLLSEAFDLAAEEDLERLEKAVARNTDATRRLRAVLRMYLPTGSGTGWTRDIDAWAEGLFTPEIREASRRLDARWRSALERVVVDGVESGEFTCDDPKAAALRITVMLDGLGVAVQVRGTLGRARSARWVAEYAAQLLGLPADALTPTTTVPQPARPSA